MFTESDSPKEKRSAKERALYVGDRVRATKEQEPRTTT